MLFAQPPEPVAGPTTVAAYRGTVAFSRYADGRYTLVLQTGRVETPVRTPPRDVPFDVDLGPDGRGTTVAVYSRCAEDPAYWATAS